MCYLPYYFIQELKPVIDGMDGIKISQGLGLQDFDLIRVIGRGSYAKVLLVRLKKNDQIYAMKVVKKELVHDDEVRKLLQPIASLILLSFLDSNGWGIYINMIKTSSLCQNST